MAPSSKIPAKPVHSPAPAHSSRTSDLRLLAEVYDSVTTSCIVSRCCEIPPHCAPNQFVYFCELTVHLQRICTQTSSLTPGIFCLIALGYFTANNVSPMSSAKRTPQTKEELDDSDDGAELSDEYTPRSARSGYTARPQVLSRLKQSCTCLILAGWAVGLLIFLAYVAT